MRLIASPVRQSRRRCTDTFHPHRSTVPSNVDKARKAAEMAAKAGMVFSYKEEWTANYVKPKDGSEQKIPPTVERETGEKAGELTKNFYENFSKLCRKERIKK